MKRKNFKKGSPRNGNFSKSKRDMKPAIKCNIVDIDGEKQGEIVVLTGLVDRIVQTAGPTVFHISDGTGILALKSFDGAGVRAHPEIEEGDAITTTVKIEEFRDELEGDVKKISKLNDSDKKVLLKKLEDLERKRAEVKEIPFLVKSPILDKLKDRMIKAATEIKLAIIQSRPIIIRHHNDTDGYSSGFTLERAILPLIEKQHGGGKSAWEFYTRAPCAAPFYEIDDSIRDTANSLRNVAKFSNKLPLVVIADNGSSAEDLLGIQQGKVHGIDFIVVDHHVFEKDVISSEVLVHINPFLVGEDGAKFSAGMLCTELARFINPTVGNINQIPAMAGMADRINNKEVIDAYLKVASEAGYEKSMLNNIATVIDFVSAKLRFMEAREYIEVLFGEPMNKQRALVDLLAPYIRKLDAKGLEMAKAAAKIEKIGSVSLQSIEIEDTFPGFGFFPKPGRAIGLAHDNAQEINKLTKLVSVGIMRTAVTIRATTEANFSVHDLIDYLNKNLPDAFVEGGGHHNAGSITFVPGKKKEVVNALKDYIKKISK